MDLLCKHKQLEKTVFIWFRDTLALRYQIHMYTVLYFLFSVCFRFTFHNITCKYMALLDTIATGKIWWLWLLPDKCPVCNAVCMMWKIGDEAMVYNLIYIILHIFYAHGNHGSIPCPTQMFQHWIHSLCKLWTTHIIG